MSYVHAYVFVQPPLSMSQSVKLSDPHHKYMCVISECSLAKKTWCVDKIFVKVIDFCVSCGDQVFLPLPALVVDQQ